MARDVSIPLCVLFGPTCEQTRSPRRALFTSLLVSFSRVFLNVERPSPAPLHSHSMAITLLFLQSSRSTQPSNAQFSKIGMSMYRGFATIFWLIISYAVAHVWADQGESPFAWGFNNKVRRITFKVQYTRSLMTVLYQVDSIAECQTFPIIIVPQSSTPNNVGVPPYYLFAFEAGGIPSVSMIGTDHNNLSWQNTHKRGKQGAAIATTKNLK